MRSPIMTAFLTAAAVACGPSAEERASRAADSLVAIADSSGRVFRGVVAGHQLAMMVDDCAVTDLATAPDENGRRPVILKPDFYPWPTVCTRESFDADTAWLTVHLGRTGLGAGGYCATGGTYRTRDGLVWERRGVNGRWKRVGSDSTK